MMRPSNLEPEGYDKSKAFAQTIRKPAQISEPEDTPVNIEEYTQINLLRDEDINYVTLR